ncbi:MAG: hypothetical protein ACTSVL_06775 [Promethearchaeota archaeon]
MKVKKSTRTIQNETRAIQLFYNLLKNFPIDPHSFTRKVYNENIYIKNFWSAIILKNLENKGYLYAFKINPIEYDYWRNKQVFTNDSIAKDLVEGFFSNLREVNLKPDKKGICVKNNNFQVIEALIKTFFILLNHIDEKGGWTGDYIKNNLDDINSLFFLRDYPIDELLNLEVFCNIINNILKIFFGESIIALFPDGRLEYIEATEELQQEFAAIRGLQKRKMKSVVESISMIRKSHSEKEYNTGLYHCRKTIENFFKDLLSFHSILDDEDPTKPKKVSDMMIKELLPLTKKNIDVLFDSPGYINHNTVETTLNHYLETIKNMSFAFTNPFSHGKGTSTPVSSPPAQATQKDLDMMFSFIIGMINTLLFFEK